MTQLESDFNSAGPIENLSAYGRDNPRSVSPNELERMYLNFDIGVVFPLGYRFDVVFGQSFRTAEFRNAPVHYWGFLNVIYNGKNYYVKRLSENGK